MIILLCDRDQAQADLSSRSSRNASRREQNCELLIVGAPVTVALAAGLSRIEFGGASTYDIHYIVMTC